MRLDLDGTRARFPGRQIAWLQTTGSTMTEAARLAADGCPSGTVVLAEEQQAGQGRFGRRWHSEREAGLYLSIVLRLSLSQDSLPVLTLALGLAAQDAIQRAAGIPCDLRWPNDLLIEGKKCAGILVQLLDGAMIAGIGINVNHASLPSDLAPTATSLRIATGRSQSREEILAALLDAVDAYTKILEQDGRDEILKLYSQSSSFVHGRRVVVEQEGSVIRGSTEGLDSSGFLVLRKDDGTRTVILAGGVRPA